MPNSLPSLPLLLALLACCLAQLGRSQSAEAPERYLYDYECLGDDAPDIPLDAVMHGQLKTPPASCREFGLEPNMLYCVTVELMFEKLGRQDSKVYVAMHKKALCERELPNIKNALANIEANWSHADYEHDCRLQGVRLRHVQAWIRKDYSFRPLVHCLSNLCSKRLDAWQESQRENCKWYLIDEE